MRALKNLTRAQLIIVEMINYKKCSHPFIKIHISKSCYTTRLKDKNDVLHESKEKKQVKRTHRLKSRSGEGFVFKMCLKTA